MSHLLTHAKATKLYDEVEELVNTAQELEEVLGSLSDKDIKGRERTDYLDEFDSKVGDLRSVMSKVFPILERY